MKYSVHRAFADGALAATCRPTQLCFLATGSRSWCNVMLYSCGTTSGSKGRVQKASVFLCAGLVTWLRELVKHSLVALISLGLSDRNTKRAPQLPALRQCTLLQQPRKPLFPRLFADLTSRLNHSIFHFQASILCIGLTDLHPLSSC